MTVRNNKSKIIQFAYGDDCFDPIKIENQSIPLVQMSLEEIYSHIQISGADEKNVPISTIFTKTIQKLYKAQKSSP